MFSKSSDTPPMFCSRRLRQLTAQPTEPTGQPQRGQALLISIRLCRDDLCPKISGTVWGTVAPFSYPQVRALLDCAALCRAQSGSLLCLRARSFRTGSLRHGTD
jgi:hypothetical protein